MRGKLSLITHNFHFITFFRHLTESSKISKKTEGVKKTHINKRAIFTITENKKKLL